MIPHGKKSPLMTLPVREKTAFPHGIYLIADAAVAADALVPSTAAAVAAGVRLVQFRDKNPLCREQVALARALCRVVHARHGLFIVNDRADLARMVDADGVHVGQDDLPVADVRTVMGPNAFVGVSTHNVEELRAAEADGADYVGFGNVFGTRSKKDAPGPVGADALAVVCNQARVPVYAIGGVGVHNLQEVVRAGAAGGAVISAVFGADDAAGAATELLERWDALSGLT